MACKLIEAAQARWRAVNAPHLVALVRAGARFERGQLSNASPSTPTPRRHDHDTSSTGFDNCSGQDWFTSGASVPDRTRHPRPTQAAGEAPATTSAPDAVMNHISR